MGKWLKVWVLGAVLAMMTVACSDDDSEDGVCPSIWQARSFQNGVTLSNVDGSILVQVEDAEPDVSFSMGQGFVRGDFTASLSFESFRAGGNDGYAQLIFSNPLQPDSGQVIVAIDSVSVSAEISSAVDQRLIAGKDGIFTVQRIDSVVTVVATVGGVIATKTAHFTDADLNMLVRLGSDGEMLNGITGIRLTDFQFLSEDTTAFNTVISDNFECQSVTILP